MQFRIGVDGADLLFDGGQFVLGDKVGFVQHDHIGIGGDFDGITQVVEGLEDVSKYPDLTAELMKRGYSDGDIKKILGQNVLRVMRDAEKVAALSTDQVDALSTAQISALSTSQLCALSADQISALNTSQAALLTGVTPLALDLNGGGVQTVRLDWE